MDNEKYNRSVSLCCPTCGGVEFSTDAESGLHTCAACGREMSREELLEANAESIEAHADEMKKEIVADFRKQLQQSFRGNKWIKLK